MNGIRERDEYLEHLWYMREGEKSTMEDLKDTMKDNYRDDVVDELGQQGFVRVTGDRKGIAFTKKGEDAARRLVRAHRLAERLTHDVLGHNVESGACEFEHTVTPELVDSICTLLGHPRECPHGLPIPEGDCCKQSATIAESSVIPATRLRVGQCARIAYINCKDDRRLHRIDGLHIRPGVTIKLHQNYPSYVIECEGSNIALDESIASDIQVWKEPCPVCRVDETKGPGEARRRRGVFGRGFRRRRRRRRS